MPYKLLLADDSVTIQRVIELTFADEDVQVVAVGDGQQAIDRITADPPDIVLADVGMPARDGYEVSAFVKGRPDLAHIPVLLLTGAFEPINQDRARLVGCNGVLAKPFEPQMLIARVKELLAGGGQSGAPAGQAATTAADPTAFPADMELKPREPVEPGGPGADAGLDSYFDRLDAAFGNLAPPTPAPDIPLAPAPATSAPASPAWASEFGDLSWPPPAAQASAPTTPPAAPGHATLSDPPATLSDPEDFPPPASLAGPPPAAVPAASLADTFGALLAAEQDEPAAFAVQAAAVAQPADVASEDLVDRVTAQVLAKMTDRVVRETVAEIVTVIAERLVREEIDRIKATAK